MTAEERLDRLVASIDPIRLGGERWFGGKGRTVREVQLVDGIVAGGGALAVVDVVFAEGEAERYAVPDGEAVWSTLLPELSEEVRRGAGGGSFRLAGVLPDPLPADERPIESDQSNSSVRLGNELLVKCYRRLWPGPHPEVELVTYLGERLGCVPRGWASVTFVDAAGLEHAVALVETLVPGAHDGWAWGRELHEALADGRAVEGWGEALGAVTAELHVALSDSLGARQATAEDRERWRARAERELADALALPDARRTVGRWMARIEGELEALTVPGESRVSRIHGDLHVGQVLRSRNGFFLIDFEGEPTRPPGERRSLESPARDVASMLRSFEHVPRWGLRARPQALPSALAWTVEQRQRFLAAYERGIAGSHVTLDRALLRAFEVEKATYEFVYADAFLPEWTPVAAGAMDALLGAA